MSATEKAQEPMTLLARFSAARAYVNESFGFSEPEVASILSGIRARGDRLITVFLYCHCVLALLLAFFYQTWFLASCVSALAMMMFLVGTKLMPGQFLTRCIAGVSLQAFVALHIYQLHGMPE